MLIIKPSFEFVSPDLRTLWEKGETKVGAHMLQMIEKIGRVCYKSERAITDFTWQAFIEMLRDRQHDSVLEHEKVTVKVICDRGVSHEIVRHRIASYSQESTRFCSYAKGKFGNQITVIDPNFEDQPDLTEKQAKVWYDAMTHAEEAYMKLIELGAAPQMARSVLPNSLKTEIVITYNLREWRHFFKLRTAPAAHPQMREITIPMLKEFQKYFPILFDDIKIKESV